MSRRRRPLATLAMVALISAGCSIARAETYTDSSGDYTTATTREQAVKFATCMRANGVSEFPDPAASGTFTVDGVVNGSKLDPNSAAWKSAIVACKDLQPSGFLGRKRSALEQDQAVKFAECIRENGVQDFPDPDPDGPLVDTNRIPSTAGRGARGIPDLNTAMQTCRGFVADFVTDPR